MVLVGVVFTAVAQAAVVAVVIAAVVAVVAFVLLQRLILHQGHPGERKLDLVLKRLCFTRIVADVQFKPNNMSLLKY